MTLIVHLIDKCRRVRFASNQPSSPTRSQGVFRGPKLGNAFATSVYPNSISSPETSVDRTIFADYPITLQMGVQLRFQCIRAASHPFTRKQLSCLCRYRPCRHNQLGGYRELENGTSLVLFLYSSILILRFHRQGAVTACLRFATVQNIPI